MIVYFNGEYVDKERVCISPDDRGFLFADGLYEVVRFYNGNPFRIKDHRSRLERGASALRFNRTRFPELEEIASHLLVKNDLAAKDSAIVYFQVTRGVAPRSHFFPADETPLTIYAYSKEIPAKKAAQEKGANVITTPDNRWSNCHIKTISLLPNTLAFQTARERGAIEAIFVRDGDVQEGAHTNIFISSGDVVKTPPLSGYLLSGITRTVVLELCETLSIPSVEEPISEADLMRAQEVFIVGTTTEITPVTRIDDLDIGDSRPGPITRRLQKALDKVIRGKKVR